MKNYFFLVVLFTLLIQGSVLSQSSNFNTQRNWSNNKKEWVVGAGATNFLGDLGGADRIGTDYSLRDLNFRSTSIGGSIAYRYRFHPYFATTTILNAGLLRGDDKRTDEVVRNARNLHFRSPVINLTQRFECIILANEKVGRRYKIGGLKGMKDKNMQTYIFSGIGVMFFNPKAFYNGAWVPLKPLRTEGQGLPGGVKEYRRFTATIPLGIGYRYGISKLWRVGVEVSYVKTFSDYIDDVHGVYYDPKLLKEYVGSDAAALSNPTKSKAAIKGNWFGPGEQRGDKQKDAVFYVNLTFTRNVTYSVYTKGRKRIRMGNLKGSRAKF